MRYMSQTSPYVSVRAKEQYFVFEVITFKPRTYRAYLEYVWKYLIIVFLSIYHMYLTYVYIV